MQKKTKLTGELRKRMAKEYKDGATLTMLSVNHKLGLPVVRQALVDAGVTIRKKGGSQPFDANRAEEMADLYIKENLTLAEIGERFDLSRERVRQILRANKVKSLGRRERSKHDQPLTAQEKRIAKAYDNGTSPAELKKKYTDLTYAGLQTILKRAGVPTKPKGFFNRRDGYEKTVKGIVRDYKRGVDTAEIADRYGLCGRTEIYKFLKRENVPVRQSEESE
jgi:uncharacterized protein (DUF433 family)